MAEDSNAHPQRGQEPRDDVNTALVADLVALREHLADGELAHAGALARVCTARHADAINLVHHLVMRELDTRRVADGLTALGLAVPGQTDCPIMVSVERAILLLRRMCHPLPTIAQPDASVVRAVSRQSRASRTAGLLGGDSRSADIRIVATVLEDAARDPGMLRDMVAAGMDCARVECAHGTHETWQIIAAGVRQAARELGKCCTVLLELGGPRMRTGPLEPVPAFAHWRPVRDLLGRVRSPGRVRLVPHRLSAGTGPRTERFHVDDEWFDSVVPGDRVEFVDARGADRELKIVAKDEEGLTGEVWRSAYVTPATVLCVTQAGAAPGVISTHLHGLPPGDAFVVLRRGDLVALVDSSVPEHAHSRGLASRAGAVIPFEVPGVLRQLHVGQSVWFDEGRIGGVLRRVTPHEALIEITTAAEEGERLFGDRSIRFPGSRLEWPAFPSAGTAELRAACACADIVCLPFVQDADDVGRFCEALDSIGAVDVGVVFRVETRTAFDNLPDILLACMRRPSVALLIAWGDLALELGYEWFVKSQDEVLRLAEVTRMPLIWGTQLLEGVARRGRPSRTDVSEAAASLHADAVMLNAGPRAVVAIAMLEDMLSRIRAHERKSARGHSRRNVSGSRIATNS